MSIYDDYNKANSEQADNSAVYTSSQQSESEQRVELEPRVEMEQRVEPEQRVESEQQSLTSENNDAAALNAVTESSVVYSVEATSSDDSRSASNICWGNAGKSVADDASSVYGHTQVDEITESEDENPETEEEGTESEDENPEADDKLEQFDDAEVVDAIAATDEYDAQEEERITFESLGLSSKVLKAIQHEGFEQPTPIQVRSIPTILSGADMIGQAQTGTGKTAAFALPILSQLPAGCRQIFALVLEPTRELALQVAASFSQFARYIDNFRVAPIYGGASYETQIRSLKHGAQIVVATPGRLIDLIEKGRLDFSAVRHIVIDEADEMLRMGFIDDVDWILEHVPQHRQTALFSATMPPVIRKIAQAHLVDPVEVRIESHTATATTVRQRYWVVSGVHKIDAMSRMLEVESYEAVIVFVRTKVDAEDVANKLAARGLACAALHGDIPQRQREKIIERLKKGSLDIIIATDVAARGLDVDRITHVFNYDIPYDAESYVHRIGRTGRAGRAGEAILFVSPRERRALRQIERVTRQKIEPMRMPTVADVNKRRLENFRTQILETIEAGGLEDYLAVISDILSDDSIEPELLAAALAKMSQRDGELLLDESQPEPKMKAFDDSEREHHRDRGGPSAEAVPLRNFPDLKMIRYRLAVGRRDGVKPGQIVGAIANEGEIDSKYIGEISIYDTFSTVDLPTGMPRETMRILYRARICGRALELREYTAEPPRRHDRVDSFERRGDKGEHFNKDERFEKNERPNRAERNDFVERLEERLTRPQRKGAFKIEAEPMFDSFESFKDLDDIPDFTYEDGKSHSFKEFIDYEDKPRTSRRGGRRSLNLVSPPRGSVAKHRHDKDSSRTHHRSGKRRGSF